MTEKNHTSFPTFLQGHATQNDAFRLFAWPLSAPIVLNRHWEMIETSSCLKTIRSAIAKQLMANLASCKS